MMYEEYINNILESRGRFNCEGYKEKHHIIPRCKGGVDEEENLIDLYPEEHFTAHKFLYEENPSDHGLCTAYFRMCFFNRKKGVQVTPEEYAIARKSYSKLRSIYYKGENNPFFGKHHTEESKKKISISKTNPDEETRKKLSESHKYIDHSYQVKRMAETNRGKKRSDEIKNKISKSKQLSGTGNNRKDKVKITNGIQNKFVRVDEINKWVNEGYYIINEFQYNKYLKLLENSVC